MWICLEWKNEKLRKTSRYSLKTSSLNLFVLFFFSVALRHKRVFGALFVVACVCSQFKNEKESLLVFLRTSEGSFYIISTHLLYL